MTQIPTLLISRDCGLDDWWKGVRYLLKKECRKCREMIEAWKMCCMSCYDCCTAGCDDISDWINCNFLTRRESRTEWWSSLGLCLTHGEAVLADQKERKMDVGCTRWWEHPPGGESLALHERRLRVSRLWISRFFSPISVLATVSQFVMIKWCSQIGNSAAEVAEVLCDHWSWGREVWGITLGDTHENKKEKQEQNYSNSDSFKDRFPLPLLWRDYGWGSQPRQYGYSWTCGTTGSRWLQPSKQFGCYLSLLPASKKLR